jgi:phosphate transport system protein
MIPLEYEIDRIREIFFEMVELVRDQMTLTKEALLTNDLEAASEVLRKEGRVNSYELTIDRECEDFLALQSPVATDLRLAIAILKMSGSLERIGDHAFHISGFIYNDKLTLTKEIIKLVHIPELFDEVDEMLSNIISALEEHNVKKAKAVFKQDKFIDKINRKVPVFMQEVMKNSKEKDIANLIRIAQIIGKIERTGDLIKNMAEETIFYIESKVVKHRKRNKKIQEMFKLKGNKGK